MLYARKGSWLMKRKQYEASKTKKVLLDKRRRGEKEVIWKLSEIQLKEVEKLGMRVEPFLYEIRTRRFNNVRILQSSLLKDIHYASRDGKWQIVRHLKKCDIKILEEYGINFYPIKYKIYLRA